MRLTACANLGPSKQKTSRRIGGNANWFDRIFHGLRQKDAKVALTLNGLTSICPKCEQYGCRQCLVKAFYEGRKEEPHRHRSWKLKSAGEIHEQAS